MSILDKINQAKTVSKIKIKHPLSNIEKSIKIDYLVGVAILSRVDELNIVNKKKFVYSLSENFTLNNQDKDSLYKDITPEKISRIINDLKSSGIHDNMMLDAAISLTLDGKISNEEKEGFLAFTEMLDIPVNLAEIFLEFGIAYKKQNIKKMFSIFLNNNANKRIHYDYYLEQSGVIGGFTLNKGRKTYSDKYLKIIRGINVMKEATLVFENCSLDITDCKINSAGNIYMKNCKLFVDVNSGIVVNNIILDDCQITSKYSSNVVEQDYGDISEKQNALLSIKNSRSTIIRNTVFNYCKHDVVVEVDSCLSITIDNCNFENNIRAIFIKGKTMCKILATSFEFNIKNDILFSFIRGSKCLCKNCNFIRKTKNTYYAIEYISGSLYDQYIIKIKDSKFINSQIYRYEFICDNCEIINDKELK